MTRIDPLREYFTISLVFVDGPKVRAQHPHGGIKPLEGGEGINEEQVPRVVKTDMTSFMSENRSIMGFVVAAVHHDIMHPTEGRHFCVSAHANRGAIVLWMLFTMLDDSDDSEQGPERVSECCHHTYYK